MNYIKGDITDVKRGVLINGVNCQNAMGSGVARAYFMKWPTVKEQYHVWSNDEMVLGKFDAVVIEPDNLYVANCWTQEYFGSDGSVYADYTAVIASVAQAVLFAQRRGLEVYTPAVGCGLGGLKWPLVKELLEIIEATSGTPITYVEYQP